MSVSPRFEARFRLPKRPLRGLSHAVQAAKDTSAGVGAVSGLAPSGPMLVAGSGLLSDGKTAGSVNHTVVNSLNLSQLPNVAQMVGDNHLLAIFAFLFGGIGSGLAGRYPMRYLNRRYDEVSGTRSSMPLEPQQEAKKPTSPSTGENPKVVVAMENPSSASSSGSQEQPTGSASPETVASSGSETSNKTEAHPPETVAVTVTSPPNTTGSLPEAASTPPAP